MKRTYPMGDIMSWGANGGFSHVRSRKDRAICDHWSGSLEPHLRGECETADAARRLTEEARAAGLRTGSGQASQSGIQMRSQRPPARQPAPLVPNPSHHSGACEPQAGTSCSMVRSPNGPNLRLRHARRPHRFGRIHSISTPCHPQHSARRRKSPDVSSHNGCRSGRHDSHRELPRAGQGPQLATSPLGSGVRSIR